MAKHHYVGLEQYVRVFESAFEIQVVQGYTVLNADSPRLLSQSELNGCFQSNSDLTPFYDQRWVKLTEEEHRAFLEARKDGSEDRFLENLLEDSSRIVASKQYSNPDHQYYALVEEALNKEKRKKN